MRVTCLLLWIFLWPATALVQDRGAENIVLHGGGSGDVAFPHALHQAVLTDCKPCHDLFPQSAGAVDRLKLEGKLKKREVMEQCRTCHKAQDENGKKAGPVGCKACHRK